MISLYFIMYDGGNHYIRGENNRVTSFFSYTNFSEIFVHTCIVKKSYRIILILIFLVYTILKDSKQYIIKFISICNSFKKKKRKCAFVCKMVFLVRNKPIQLQYVFMECFRLNLSVLSNMFNIEMYL